MNALTPFEIPVAIFTFKRIEKTLEIIDRIAQVKPHKIYIISDNGRNQEEIDLVKDLREKVEDKIDWDCKVIKKYASKNIGVYENIANGAKWVLQQEEFAIFLEDDNLPETTFFKFCQEMLALYKDDTRVLWICGTNYLKKYSPQDGSSYVFTKHMLPCGWATWSHKFNKFYDGNLELWQNEYLNKRVRFENTDKKLLKQDIGNWDRESRAIRKGFKPDSWDYQMSFTMRVHGLYAIVPMYNQIKNIGVDINSIHGGTTFEYEMTRRFCGLETTKLDFPLIHPKAVLADLLFEKLTGKIIVLPWKERLKIDVSMLLKKIFNVDVDESFSDELKKKCRLNDTK
ncbi:Putative nucleotide-diphospho-sugar transferase. Putative rhamnosyltransferase [Flavobacterium psychrophilum]|uniref:hemolytic protein HlpA n=1 Tax=Flavobacterium psychrophilum TaxID=96345 RepID=UPI000B7C47E3|nr:hemolytic protein HlpA [Flavobacterium psychrophilum]SNB28769.1 Putative nucleotide-diphospho-sugar transferase. Putative rhamnosyltransferase [Flavobacterium psychrophilum]